MAYPIDVDDYKKAGDAKIGDLVAFSDTRLLLIEQGKDKHGTMRNIVYALDISDTDDLSAVRTPAGKRMEFASAVEMRALRMIRKQKVLDLREIGWTAEKAEGLAIVDGGLAVINDNDFGLALDQQTVGMAMVVAAFELHRELPSRGRPGQPDSAHGRFGTGADEPDLVHGGKGPHTSSAISTSRSVGAP